MFWHLVYSVRNGHIYIYIFCFWEFIFSSHESKRCWTVHRDERINSVGCLWHSHGKNPFRLYPKLQSQPIGLRKVFIDYFFFQVDQWDCTKPLSIFDRLASSEERFRTFHCTNKLQSQPIELPKIFIDYLFFQADQSDCTKSVSLFNRFASSEERWNQDVPCQICRPWVFPLVV